MTPTVPCHPTSEERQKEPIRLNAKLGLFTHFGNVLDLCAISVPAGIMTSDIGTQLPFGVSLVCARGMDGKLFYISRRPERGLKQVV